MEGPQGVRLCTTYALGGGNTGTVALQRSCHTLCVADSGLPKSNFVGGRDAGWADVINPVALCNNGVEVGQCGMTPYLLASLLCECNDSAPASQSE